MAEYAAWPKEHVIWRDESQGHGSAGLYGFADTLRDGVWYLIGGPKELIVECERPYYFDLSGASVDGEPVPSTYGITIPIEAFPALIERMLFALGANERPLPKARREG